MPYSIWCWFLMFDAHPHLLFKKHDLFWWSGFHSCLTLLIIIITSLFILVSIHDSVHQISTSGTSSSWVKRILLFSSSRITMMLFCQDSFLRLHLMMENMIHPNYSLDPILLINWEIAGEDISSSSANRTLLFLYWQQVFLASSSQE